MSIILDIVNNEFDQRQHLRSFGYQFFLIFGVARIVNIAHTFTWLRPIVFIR